MKTIKIFSLCLTLILALSSCSKNFLDTEMTGGSLSQEQFDDMSGINKASVRGLYLLLYADQTSSDHIYFGQKSIDMATDMTASDMALVNNLYGWWGEEAALRSYASDRSATTWSYYFIMINNANNLIRKFNGLTEDKLTADDKADLAQAKVMRAFAYYNLAYIYAPSVDDNQTVNRYAQYMNSKDLVGDGLGANYPVCPIYDASERQYNDSTDLLMAQPLSSVTDVYEFVIADLNGAIALFDSVAADYTRESKLAVDANVAKVLLAYTYLQAGGYDVYETENGNADYYAKALALVDDVINNSGYMMLNYDEVLTNGFNNVNSASWMWGHDVTIESRTGLASFWGQVDVYTYSYAWAGSIIGIDQTLWESIADTDIRKQWFDASGEGEKKNLNPYNKFYSAANGNKSTNEADIDREWLQDVVYMRIEEAYLIASEAAWRNGDLATAKNYLKQLVEQRDTTIAAQIDGYNEEEFKTYLYKNWRVELWGEGRALRTLKRFCIEAPKERGKNHYYNLGAGNKVEFNSATLTFWMPGSEYQYNSNYRQDVEQE
jgi:hypothetical protein